MDDAQAQLRKLMTEHPDLPVICLAEGPDYDAYNSYYCSVSNAHIERLLWTRDVSEKWIRLPHQLYYDEEDAIEDVADGLITQWANHAREEGGMVMRKELNPARFLTRFCGFDCNGYTLGYMATDMAERIVPTFPWKDYIVIDCYC